MAGVDIEAGVVRVANKLRPIGDATWRIVPAAGTAVDLMASADLVETPQLRLRRFGSRKADVYGAYFNPEEYRQWLGVAAIRKRSAGWHCSAALGAGREQNDGVGSRASYLAEARAETTVMRDSKLVLHGGYYRSAAGVIDNPNYAYRQLGVSLVVPLH
ncbi:hypothetical protein [Massilia glaciei]|uniref:Uncharacterized protein n=1 Tax=Massilia glaciei TaxID=1524097 RepID=A0A2U2HEH6_9BURK|nr:hypothetical protein [Massilia glaciei]PWF42047.1 hypothetical protein C7C56_023545 [Massilia glaciei]